MTTTIRSSSDGTYGALQVGGSDVMRFGADNSGQLAGFRNRIINGKMEIAQRGTGGTGANTYAVDRWQLFHAGTAPTWAKVSGGAIGASYFSNLIGIAGAAGNTGINLNQRIESVNSADLAGKTVTFSAYVLHTDTGGPRNFVIMAQRPNTLDNWTSVTSIANSGNISVPLNTWTRITWTTTLPASGLNLGLSFELSTGAVVATQGVYVTGVQLEAGSIATPFEHRPYGLELSLCQRYYETGSTFVRRQNIDTVGRNWMEYISFHCTKRVAPTMTQSITASTNVLSSAIGGDVNSASWTCSGSGSSIDFQFNSAWAASAEL